MIQNENNNRILNETKDEVSLSEKKLKEQSQEISDYKNKIKELEEKSKNLEDLENITVNLEKKKTGLLEENSRLENNNKILEQKFADLQGLSNLSVDDLQSKIISMKEVNDLLYKQLQDAEKQKLEFESKLIKLQTAFNDQLEEEKREITRLYKNKKLKENREASFMSEGEEANNILTNLEDGKKE